MKKPPKIAELIIRLLARSGNRQTLMGDLEEEYQFICSENGKIRAKLWYVGQIFIPFNNFIRSHTLWSLIMFKNYLKTALRNIEKHRSFTIINISGLAIGLACCILLAIYINSELSFDSYHEKKDRIFRIGESMSFKNYSGDQSATNGVIAAALKDNYPEVEETVRLRFERTSTKYKDKQFLERFFYVDKSVFNVFSWPLLKGDPNTTLEVPFSIVLTEETATKYFGNEDPMGKIITLNEDEDYKVTGIIADFPRYSTLRSEGLCSFSTLNTPGKMNTGILTKWISHNFNTYILLKEGVEHEDFQNKVENIYYDYAAEEMKANGSAFKVFLQPIKDIYLHPLNRDFGPMTYVYIFSAVASFILLIACVNFMNLSTARSMTRATEVGVRKVLGANRGRLIKQFLTEALLLSTVSMIIAMGISYAILPVISEYAGRDLLNDIYGMPWFLPGIFASSILVGLIAGSYPSLVLSRFQPVQVMKGKFNAPKTSVSFRRILVITQFVISIALIIGTALMIQQLDYLKNKDVGFDKDHVVCVSVRDQLVRNTLPVLQKKFMDIPEVINSGAGSRLPGWSGPLNSKIPEGYTKDDTQLMLDINIDDNYLQTLGINIVQGRNFSENYASDPHGSVIINETAVKKFGWDNPIGKTIQTKDVEKPNEKAFVGVKVIGVVQDFHLSWVSREIQPLFIANDLDYPFGYGKIRVLVTRIKPENIQGTISKMETIWKEVFPDKSFNYFFLDDNFSFQFLRIEGSRDILSYFTFLAIFIACLGLFGMVAYAAEKRTKEIGIRKTLGCSIPQVIVLLSRELITLVLVANIVAYPLAYYAISQWLSDFPYRIDISLYTFFLSTIVAVVISILTISYQSIKAATANPVEALKYE